MPKYAKYAKVCQSMPNYAKSAQLSNHFSDLTAPAIERYAFYRQKCFSKSTPNFYHNICQSTPHFVKSVEMSNLSVSATPTIKIYVVVIFSSSKSVIVKVI